MRLQILLVLLSFATSNVEGIYECCPEENKLSLVTEYCSNNISITLECPGHRLPVYVSRFADYDYLLLDNGTLVDLASNAEVRYCQSYPDDDSVNLASHIYIYCHDAIETFEDHSVHVGAILGYISVVFIILTIIVYAMVPKLLDLQGICMLHTLVGLAGGYIFLGIIQLNNLGSSACSTVAFLTYFCFIYMFFWLNMMSFHIWRTTVNPGFSSWTRKWSTIYHIFAIGGTLIFLIFLLVAHHSPSEMWDNIRPGIGLQSCWFQSIRETMIFFYGPITCLLILNVVLYVWTIIILWRQAENTQNKILKYRLKLCVRLFIIMGITWSFEIITALLKDPRMSLFGKVMFFLLDLFNILQGVLIFLVLVVFRKKVRRALASKNICNIQFPNSWKYLEDEEMESAEAKINNTVTEYTGNDVDIKI